MSDKFWGKLAIFVASMLLPALANWISMNQIAGGMRGLVTIALLMTLIGGVVCLRYSTPTPDDDTFGLEDDDVTRQYAIVLGGLLALGLYINYGMHQLLGRELAFAGDAVVEVGKEEEKIIEQRRQLTEQNTKLLDSLTAFEGTQAERDKVLAKGKAKGTPAPRPTIDAGKLIDSLPSLNKKDGQPEKVVTPREVRASWADYLIWGLLLEGLFVVVGLAGLAGLWDWRKRQRARQAAESGVVGDAPGKGLRRVK